MKKTWAWLSLLLFAWPLRAADPLAARLDLLLDAPWADSLSTYFAADTWQRRDLGRRERRRDHEYALRAFTQTGANDSLAIFSYALPALATAREAVLVGFMQWPAQDVQTAREQHDRVADLLRQRGFTVEENDGPPRGYRPRLWRSLADDWQLIYNVVGGDVQGLLYYYERRDTRYLRLALRHSTFSTYDWPDWNQALHNAPFFHPFRMPPALIDSLEADDIATTLGAETWQAFKALSAASEHYYIPREGRLLVERLKEVYQRAYDHAQTPLYMALREYLARHLFRHLSSADRVEPQWPNGGDAFRANAQWLNRKGLAYDYGKLGRSHIYRLTLTQKLATRHRDTYWGQWAFVELMMRGFAPGCCCKGGSQLWPRALEEGRAFLREYPDSPFAADVRFYMGQAEETAFSVGRLRNTHHYYSRVPPSEESRARALAHYEVVLKSPRADYYAPHLRFTMPRLRLGVGTGTRVYYCIYD